MHARPVATPADRPLLLKEEAGNLYISTGFRIDLAYNEGTGILTVSSHGDYARSVSKH